VGAHQKLVFQVLFERQVSARVGVILMQVLVDKQATALAVAALVHSTDKVDEARVEDGVRVSQDRLHALHLLLVQILLVVEHREHPRLVELLQAQALGDHRVLLAGLAQQQRVALEGEYDLGGQVAPSPVLDRGGEVALEGEALEAVDAREDVDGDVGLRLDALLGRAEADEGVVGEEAVVDGAGRVDQAEVEEVEGVGVGGEEAVGDEAGEGAVGGGGGGWQVGAVEEGAEGVVALVGQRVHAPVGEGAAGLDDGAAEEVAGVRRDREPVDVAGACRVA